MAPSVFAFYCLFACLAAAVGLTMLLGRRATPLTVGRTLTAAGAVLVVIAVFVVLGHTGPVRFRVFGVMQLAWITCAMVVPLCGALVLLQGRGGRVIAAPVRAFAAASLLMVPVAVYAMRIEPRRLVLEEATLEARAPLSRDLRIGVLSDLQCSTVGAHPASARNGP